jgi:ribulose-5-phosphate 4-epimerase/fuculose-1-phosphate aldolase
MANHGVLVVGETVAEAYDRLYYLERTCQVQLYAMWTGRRLKHVPQPIAFRSLETVARPARARLSRLGCERHRAVDIATASQR